MLLGSLMLKLVRFYLPSLFQAFIYAIIFSSPIWCGAILLHYDLPTTYIALNTILAPLALIAFLKVPKKIRLLFGFIVGMMLFSWVGFSFRFSPFPYLGSLASILAALIYGFIFWILLWSSDLIFRAFMLILLGFIHPFYFDWLQVRAFFAYSFFDVDFLSFICIILACLCICEFYKQIKSGSHTSFCIKIKINRKKDFKLSNFKLSKLFAMGLCCVFFSIALIRTNYIPHDQISLPKIALAQTQIPQNLRWDPSVFLVQQKEVLSLIKYAKALNYQAIILPESSLPIPLNMSPTTINQLQDLSKDIAIILGSLDQKDQSFFNSTYIFNNEKMQIIHKAILAPFGERIPLPDFLAKPISRAFFDTDSGFDHAQSPQDFTLFNLTFRNAICYEGTSSALYKDHPKLIVMISNNAWFTPSIEPYFQQILLKYYARMHNSTILHSANGSNSMLIIPALFNADHHKIDIITNPDSIPLQRLAQ